MAKASKAEKAPARIVKPIHMPSGRMFQAGQEADLQRELTPAQYKRLVAQGAVSGDWKPGAKDVTTAPAKPLTQYDKQPDPGPEEPHPLSAGYDEWREGQDKADAKGRRKARASRPAEEPEGGEPEGTESGRPEGTDHGGDE